MNSCLRSRRIFAACVLLLAASMSFAAEPAYPTRPIRLLIPFAPGGGSDTLARIITPKLTDALGQTWVVDNRGGAAGNLAAEIVARAAPDGHTVFMGFNTVLAARIKRESAVWAGVIKDAGIKAE